MGGMATFYGCALTGADAWGGPSQCYAPYGRLHWATIVAHYRALAAFAAYQKNTGN